MPRRQPGSLLPLEVSILAACRDAGTPGIHGFALAQRIADGDEARRLTATGTLYRALHRLDDSGLIENWWEDPNEAAAAGRPLRRLYRITGTGATALARAESDANESALRRIDPGFVS
jgi:PadR family transcriptional regulator PadR